MINEPCYYIPHELFEDEKYKSYSAETKLLFGIVISTCTSASCVTSLSDLIKFVGERKIKQMIKEIKKIEDEKSRENKPIKEE